MNKAKFMKKGIALTMSIAIAATGVPGTSLSGAGVFSAIASAQEETGKNMLKKFDFDAGIDGWYYGSGWEYNYSAGGTSSVEADNNRLKMNVDYSKDADKDWSQATAVYETSDSAFNLNGATSATVDFFYDTSKMTTGNFAVKLYCDEGLDCNTDVDFSKAETVEGTIVKVPVELNFSSLGANASSVKKIAIQLIGKLTDYKGAVWFDNFTIYSEAVADTSVNSTIAVKSSDKEQVSISGGKLTTYKKDGNKQTTKLSSTLKLVDKKASKNTKNLYAYLQAVGKSDSAIYGHQNDILRKAGSSALTESDTKDVTESISGIFGFDSQVLNGDEYTVDMYNASHGTSLKKTARNNIKVAANISNEAINEGSIVTMSTHFPNFANVGKNPNYNAKTDPAYAKYDFCHYTAPDTTNDPMNQILPGQKYNKVFTSYLDMIAEYAKQVKGAVIFRPFHECTGSWFWWGAAYCDAETYKNVYRYTVEYLRDTKNVHNLIYAYSPSNSGAGTVADYGVRYPGDAYVDMVGFDMYDKNPTDDGTWMKQFKKQLEVTSSFAKKHNKLVAVSETGISNDTQPGESQTALLKSGNKNKDWYNNVLDIVSDSDASFFLLWANFGKTDGYYSPYVDSVNEDGTLHGHEMLDSFISFYNDSRSIFAANQKKALNSGKFGTINAKAAVTGVTGYITAPISGQRFLKAASLKAKLTGASKNTKVKFVLQGTAKVTLNAKAGKNGYYSANLSAANLKKIGKKLGTISLHINNKKVQKISAIWNIKPEKADPYLIDGFENYYGVDDQLNKAWTTNADSDCKITLSLDKKNKDNGTYGMKFVYDETATGWGGATISKEVDWSACNALQFYMVPDGNNQKTVIQINANGTTYEAYLNTYEEFKKNGNKPMRVTIPFAEFCQRDTEGNPKGGLVSDAAKINSFGLWINAISDSEAVKDGRVKGTLYYDSITAVKTTKTEADFEVVSAK